MEEKWSKHKLQEGEVQWYKNTLEIGVIVYLVYKREREWAQVDNSKRLEAVDIV